MRDQRGRWATLLCLTALVLLAVFRSLVPCRFEQYDFNSDQAVVGLMAKHLSEGRGFPLFFYGQHYMLGVQAWITAPVFLMLGPTFHALKLPMLVLNAVLCIAVFMMLVHRGLTRGAAFVATLPLAVLTPALASHMTETLGASVEPFLYILILWKLRHRAFWFGLLLVLATLHREFSIFAFPAAAVCLWLERRWWSARQWLWFEAGAGSLWLAVDLAARHLGTMGPGSAVTGSAVREAEMVSHWVDLGGYLDRTRHLFECLPDFFGGIPRGMAEFGLVSDLTVGSLVAGYAFGAALLVAAVVVLPAAASRLSRALRVSTPSPGPLGLFLLYLGLVAAAGAAAYGLNPQVGFGLPVFRYALFVLWAPVALIAAVLATAPSRALRGVVTALVLVWAAATLRDTLRLNLEYRDARPVSERAQLANYLVARGVKYGVASYWDAVAVAFLSQERVTLSSADFIRIEAYQRAADAHPDALTIVTRMPTTCDAHDVFLSWCVEVPAPR